MPFEYVLTGSAWVKIIYSLYTKNTKITCLSSWAWLKKKKKKIKSKNNWSGRPQHLQACKHTSQNPEIQEQTLFHLYFRLTYFTTEIETVFPCAAAAKKSVMRQYKPEVEVTWQLPFSTLEVYCTYTIYTLYLLIEPFVKYALYCINV